MALDETYSEDKILLIDGIRVILEEPMDIYLERATLDYREGFLRRGFFFQDVKVAEC
ncbi:MAG: hypothetical protein IMW85_00245 [Thermicanus sp.]|nr:hypothetical protein [Thermicanus sp.]